LPFEVFSLASCGRISSVWGENFRGLPGLVATPMLDLQLNYPDEAKLSFSGPSKVLKPADITAALIRLMEKPKDIDLHPRISRTTF